MNKKKKQQAAPFAVRSEHDGFSVSPASVAEKPETGWQHFRKHFFDINDNDHLSGYEIFFIFVVSAILGALIEQIFCVITNGYWERRTSLVYGEFGYAYSIGGTLLTLLLYRNTKTEFWRVFFKSAIICSLAEYIMSWGEELVFGHVSWDYHNMPLNINGRICFLYGCFWGVLGLVWAKIIYPGAKRLIRKVPQHIGKVLFWIFFVFLLYDTIITVCAVSAFNARKAGNPVDTPFERLMEWQFSDKYMIWTYPNSYEVTNGQVASDTLKSHPKDEYPANPIDQMTSDSARQGYAIHQAPVSCIQLVVGAAAN